MGQGGRKSWDPHVEYHDSLTEALKATQKRTFPPTPFPVTYGADDPALLDLVRDAVIVDEGLFYGTYFRPGMDEGDVFVLS